jgi:hypothetical protein
VRRRIIVGLLAAQAIAFAAWWLVLVIVPASRAEFHPHEPSLMAFWLADAAVIATTLAAAIAVWQRLAWARAALWAAAGAITYAALYCVALWIATGAAGLAAAAMAPSAALAIVLAREGSR